MQLKLKNIGMIKEADVNIDGLTVIAGENDTGKSTVGKALYLAFKYTREFSTVEKKFEYYFKLEKLLFDSSLEKGTIKIDDKAIVNRDNVDPIRMDSSINTDKSDVTMIETPVIWNFFKFFNAIEKIKTEASFFDQNYEIPYPYLMWDLYKKLSLAKNSTTNLSGKNFFLNEIKNIIDGEFIKDDFGDFVYKKGDKKIPIINTATGIKQFGILQKLIENNYIHDESILILDEPEVHLHPKWQLKMAELIVELVKNGVKVVVNSHSPYMIEALKRYSEVEKIEDKTNFYLAQNGYIHHQDSLENIFEKLALPMRELKKLKMKKYLK